LGGNPEGSIYWTPQTGAHLIYGAIRAKWASMGWEKSSLGYPTSDEFAEGGYRRSNFERGYIRWTPERGAEVMSYGDEAKSPGAFGGIRVNGIQLAANNVPFAGDATFMSESTLCGLWHNNLANLNEWAKNMVRNAANPRMRGFSVRSDAQMRLTQTCSARAEMLTACADKVTVRINLPRNLFLFHVTTPGPLPGWTDPELSVDWDMEARVDILIPQTVQSPLGIGAPSFAVTNIKLDSQNASGDLAKAAYEVYTYLGGKDILAQFTHDWRFFLPNLERTIASLAPQLSRIPAGYRIESCVKGDVVVLNGMAPLPPGAKCPQGLTGPNCDDVIIK